MKRIFNGFITGAIFVALQGIGFLTNRSPKDKGTKEVQPIPATSP